MRFVVIHDRYDKEKYKVMKKYVVEEHALYYSVIQIRFFNQLVLLAISIISLVNNDFQAF